mmetsp:Transcript_14002/g.29922  ORF Transcript_14002/g.29922 Transcript_14002/m.29922 type:complete len:641 (-) Transcript_14002:499-2421(-)
MQPHRPVSFVDPLHTAPQPIPSEAVKPVCDPQHGAGSRKEVNTPREKRRMPHLTDDQLRWTLQARLQRQEELDRNGTRNAELWNEIAEQFKVKWGQERPCLSLHHRFDKEVAAYREYCRVYRRAQDAGQSKEELDRLERPMYAALFEEHAFDVRDPPISEASEDAGGACSSRQTQRHNKRIRIAPAPPPPPPSHPSHPSQPFVTHPSADGSQLLIVNAKIVNFERIHNLVDNSVKWRPVIESGAVLVRGKHVVEVVPAGRMLSNGTNTRCAMIDAEGRFLFPGFCDAHVHVIANTTNLSSMSDQPRSLVSARAMRILEGMLMRGFTTVRDAGGADFGLSQAVDEMTICGPRILFSGHALSQTGGHGDMRKRNHNWLGICSCSTSNTTIGRVCNGPQEVREACRDEFRKGASQIKIMASGGVASPTDKLTSTQFSEEEIRAAVEEAQAVGSYVMAHAYHPDAVLRCIRNGVRSIEHGNHLDSPVLQQMLKHDAYLVPTLITYKHLGTLPPDQAAKVGDLVEKGMEIVKLADDMGVRMAFGSDLLGENHCHQLEGMILQGKATSPASVLAHATAAAADLFQMEGKVGCIKAGSFADMILFEQNPLDNLEVLRDPAAMRMIIKEGRIVKNLVVSVLCAEGSSS